MTHRDSTPNTTTLSGRPSPLEVRALAVTGLVLLIVGAAGIWASLRPHEQSVSRGRLSLTERQVFTVMERQVSGPGCPAILQQIRMEIDKRTAMVRIPALGTFEVRAYYSGYIVVLPRSPVLEPHDCRFNPLYIGPFA